MNNSKNAFYASVIAKLPRKQKEQRFEVQVDDGSPIAAREALLVLIKEHNLRGPRCAQIQIWGVSEFEFVDSNGVTQTMVSRNIFSSGSAIAVDLN